MNRCSVMRMFVFCAVGFSLCSSAIADDREPILASIVTSEFSGGPVVKVDLGAVEAGKQIGLSLRLLNATTKEIEFDSVRASCSCTKLKPKKGRIAPGDGLDFSFSLQTAPVPPGVKAGGNVYFMNGPRAAFEMRFLYGYHMHAGFATQIAMVQWDRQSQIEFELPAVIGPEVQSKDIRILTDGFPGAVEYSLTPDRKKLAVSVAPESEESPPYYCQVQMLHLVTGAKSACRVIIEGADPVRIFPKFVRLRLDEKKEKFQGVFYVLPAEDISIGRIAAKVAGKTYRCESQPTSGVAQRFLIELPVDTVKAANESGNEKNRPTNVELAIELATQTVNVSIPCTFWGIQ